MYSRAIYSQNTVNTLIAPSGSFGDSVKIALNHPFLSDAQRNALCGFDTDPAVGVYKPRFTQAQCDAAGAAVGPNDPNYLTVDTQLRRRNVEGGPRISDYTAHYFNYSLGLRGELTDSISWDVYGSYGKSDQTQVQKGYWMKSRFRQSLLAGPNGCNDASNGCVPVDFFGPTGSITSKMNDFLLGGESRIATKFDMTQVVANISGEAGFASPWANDEVNFAAGFEFRDYTGSQESDVLSQSGDLGGAGSAQPNISGSYSVQELIAEAIVPVIQDAEFAEEVTLELGARYSDYNIRADGADGFSDTTWKVGFSWTPIQDVR
ncbi:MAG: TonB-dependent receptor, partial [Cellvibrionaceae bacterium]|nr:TonB-dependent receptor [Cellvibrionaceae bacterium]